MREIGSRLEHRWLPVATFSKSTMRRSTRDKRGEREKAWTQASSSAFSLHSSRFRCKASRSKGGWLESKLLDGSKRSLLCLNHAVSRSLWLMMASAREISLVAQLLFCNCPNALA